MRRLSGIRTRMGRPAVVVAVGEVGPGVGEVGMVEVGGDGVGDGDLGLFHIRLCIAWRFYLLLGRMFYNLRVSLRLHTSLPDCVPRIHV